MINRLYRSAKWDWARLIGRVPEIGERQKLWTEIERQVGRLMDGESEVEIVVETGSMIWNPLGVPCRRLLQLKLLREGMPPVEGSSAKISFCEERKE